MDSMFFAVLAFLSCVVLKEVATASNITQVKESKCFGEVFTEKCPNIYKVFVTEIIAGAKMKSQYNGTSCTPDVAECCSFQHGDCYGKYISEEELFRYQTKCIGKNFCGLPAAQMLTLKLNCNNTIYPPVTTYLDIEFDCIDGNAIGDFSNVMFQNDQKGSFLYLWSGSDTYEELEATTYTCSVEADCGSTISVSSLDFRFADVNFTCIDGNTLTIQDYGDVQNFTCASNNNFTKLNLYNSNSNYITLTYTGTSPGGYLWLEFSESTSGGNLSINCPSTIRSNDCIFDTTTVESTPLTLEETVLTSTYKTTSSEQPTSVSTALTTSPDQTMSMATETSTVHTTTVLTETTTSTVYSTSVATETRTSSGQTTLVSTEIKTSTEQTPTTVKETTTDEQSNMTTTMTDRAAAIKEDSGFKTQLIVGITVALIMVIMIVILSILKYKKKYSSGREKTKLLDNERVQHQYKEQTNGVVKHEPPAIIISEAVPPIATSSLQAKPGEKQKKKKKRKRQDKNLLTVENNQSDSQSKSSKKPNKESLNETKQEVKVQFPTIMNNKVYPQEEETKEDDKTLQFDDLSTIQSNGTIETSQNEGQASEIDLEPYNLTPVTNSEMSELKDVSPSCANEAETPIHLEDESDIAVKNNEMLTSTVDEINAENNNIDQHLSDKQSLTSTANENSIEFTNEMPIEATLNSPNGKNTTSNQEKERKRKHKKKKKKRPVYDKIEIDEEAKLKEIERLLLETKRAYHANTEYDIV